MKRMCTAMMFLAPLASFAAMAQDIDSKEVQRRLQAMPPEKRQELLQNLMEATDQFNLIVDLQSGTCKRASEVQMKAMQGDAHSVYVLSDMYHNGWCVAQDAKQFHAYLEKAAAVGVASAAFDLGMFSEDGREGYSMNYTAAERWYERAIKGGDERAMLKLGTMRVEGKGRKDAAGGIRLLQQAANSKDNLDASKRALGLLGLYFLDGKFLPRNVAKARSYGLTAAARCEPLGMLIVAMTYDTPTTLVQAYAWTNAAVEHADPSQQQFAVNARNDYESRMDAGSIVKGQALTTALPVCASQ